MWRGGSHAPILGNQEANIMYTPRLSEMKEASDYLAAHPEVMKEELRWMGLTMPAKDQSPDDVVEQLVGKPKAPVRQRRPR